MIPYSFVTIARINRIVAGLIACMTCASVRAGGIEMLCSGSLPPDTATSETWVGGTTINWSLIYRAGAAPNERIYVPGFPSTVCIPAPLNLTPGAASILAGAEAWTSIGANISISATPTLTPDNGPIAISAIVPPDGVNVVTFWEDDLYFAAIGGAAVIANTTVDILIPGAPIPMVGGIVEADIAFNAAGPTLALPNWGWVEEDQAQGVQWCSNPPATLPFSPPTNGYVDIRGVATHEFGHFLGVAHSLIDSILTPTSNLFPTMLLPGQPEITTCTAPATLYCLEVSFAYVGAACATTTQRVTTALATNGLLGRNASSLEPDDITGLLDQQGYATTSTGGIGFGGIEGVVQAFDPLGGTIEEFRGALVTAVKVGSANTFRASALSRHHGEFSILGLLPGDYYLSIQRVEQFQPAPVVPFTPLSTFEVYFSPTIPWPNYIFVGPPGSIFNGCLRDTGTFAAYPEAAYAFHPEYYDSAENFAETRYQAATKVTVVANSISRANFDVTNARSIDATLAIGRSLPVTPQAPPQFGPLSDRGEQFDSTQFPSPDIFFSVQFPPTLAGTDVYVDLLFDDQRKLRTLNGQLLEIDNALLPAAPTSAPGTSGVVARSNTFPGWVRVAVVATSGFPLAPLRVSFNPAQQLPATLDWMVDAVTFNKSTHPSTNVFVQAIIRSPATPNDPIVSNVVNLWLVQ